MCSVYESASVRNIMHVDHLFILKMLNIIYLTFWSFCNTNDIGLCFGHNGWSALQWPDHVSWANRLITAKLHNHRHCSLFFIFRICPAPISIKSLRHPFRFANDLRFENLQDTRVGRSQKGSAVSIVVKPVTIIDVMPASGASGGTTNTVTATDAPQLASEMFWDKGVEAVVS